MRQIATTTVIKAAEEAFLWGKSLGRSTYTRVHLEEHQMKRYIMRK